MFRTCCRLGDHEDHTYGPEDIIVTEMIREWTDGGSARDYGLFQGQIPRIMRRAELLGDRAAGIYEEA